MFNTLKYARMLEEVGFTRDEAETTIKILDEVMEDKLASKQDIKDLRVETNNNFIQFREELRHTMEQLESRLTIKMGAMMVAFVAALTAIQRMGLK